MKAMDRYATFRPDDLLDDDWRAGRRLQLNEILMDAPSRKVCPHDGACLIG
jgi:hypothetical protein